MDPLKKKMFLLIYIFLLSKLCGTSRPLDVFEIRWKSYSSHLNVNFSWFLRWHEFKSKQEFLNSLSIIKFKTRFVLYNKAARKRQFFFMHMCQDLINTLFIFLLSYLKAWSKWERKMFIKADMLDVFGKEHFR